MILDFLKVSAVETILSIMQKKVPRTIIFALLSFDFLHNMDISCDI